MELRYKRTCFKVQYFSKQEAKNARKELNHLEGFDLKDWYWCGECGCYHLTTMDKQQSRNLKKKNAKQ